MSQITEVDGPPQAYFELYDGDHLLRRSYRTLRAPSMEILQDNIDRLRLNLSRVHGPGTPMIFWRIRPQDDDPYCRLITSPPLPDDIWRLCGWDQSGTGYSPP